MRRADLERAARRLAQVLGEKDCLLVGGMAVAAHGFVRGTVDVDFVVREPLREVQSRLRDQRIPSTLFRGDPAEGDFPCLKGKLYEVPFDVLPALVPLDWGKAIEIPMGKRARLNVVDLVGLLRLKLRAGGPKDLWDVAALVLRHEEQRTKALELAVAYGVADKLDVWLDDSRVRAAARADKASETRRR